VVRLALQLPPPGEPNGCAPTDRFMTESQTSIKTAARGSVAATRNALQWPDVARVLQRPETRQRVLDRYRAAGFTPDQFERSAKARACIADCITRCEDWLELAHPRWQSDRAALAGVRRVLELELR
jgi:hypothetical protein